MTVYLVVPTKRKDALVKAAHEAELPVFSDLFTEGGFLVSFAGTASELGKKLGMDKDANQGTGIVQPLTGYYGYANQAIWDWVNIHKDA
ncbi:hypothetical protein [Pseudomonas sp. SDO5591_S426]